MKAAAYQRKPNHRFGYDLHASAVERSNTMVATEHGRARKDKESRLAQGAAGDQRFRRRVLRTPKGVVCRDSTLDHYRETSSSWSAKELHSNYIPFCLPNRKEVSADFPSEARCTQLHNSAIQR